MMREKKALTLLGSLRGRAREISDESRRLCEELDNVMDRALNSEDGASVAAEAVEEISANLTAVAATAEEFSVTMQQIRESARQSQDNVRAVSESTGELATASTEIAQNTERARSVSSEAVSSVDYTLTQVESLEAVAGEISNVTQVIHDISEQTKVLALNATIEAARAQGAGRGFAVVAREVKDLAGETREATAYIRQKVGTIEESIATTIKGIKKVAGVINEVNEVVNNIAAAAEEQSISTRTIAENADMASEHFVEISGAIDEGVAAMQDVSRSIATAAGQSKNASEASRETASEARAIARKTEVSFALLVETMERLTDMMSELQSSQLPIDAAVYKGGEGLFRFAPRFSVLVDSMDAEHQKLFDYINQIHALAKEEGGQDEQNRIFIEFAAYTREHFASEEAMLERNNYPGLAEQKEQHGKLLDTVDSYLEALGRGEKINMIKALQFLNTWLINHIMKTDRGYGDHFAKQGITP